MRVFAAIPLSEEVRAAIGTVQSRLAGLDWPVRWVQDHGLHLTIRFYGEVEPDIIESLSESLARSVAELAPVPFEVGGLGVFPNRRKPRVIWIGVDAGPSLELLHHRIELGAAELGLPGEARSMTYRPHVTLGRVKRDANLPMDALAELDRDTTKAGGLADQVLLYQSTLSSGGARYRSLGTFSLEDVWAS